MARGTIGAPCRPGRGRLTSQLRHWAVFPAESQLGRREEKGFTKEIKHITIMFIGCIPVPVPHVVSTFLAPDARPGAGRRLRHVATLRAGAELPQSLRQQLLRWR